ncbi:hypothetical protein ElyMa_003299900 [Elysia marginata]|uniref:Uncharacterized protein n=1 Tax=Elysia marginata TaxID=1093978 RepID=A0AAV4JDT6_9GAST|nr:hypothetical protein ElyMa_003299900 [Elysia marginata]
MANEKIKDLPSKRYPKVDAWLRSIIGRRGSSALETHFPAGGNSHHLNHRHLLAGRSYGISEKVGQHSYHAADGTSIQTLTQEPGEHQDREAAPGQRDLQELQPQDVHHDGGAGEQAPSEDAHGALHGRSALARHGETPAHPAHNPHGGDHRDMTLNDLQADRTLNDLQAGWGPGDPAS